MGGANKVYSNLHFSMVSHYQNVQEIEDDFQLSLTSSDIW
jgi:hypothetical protein